MKHFQSTKNKAVSLAKEILREENNVKRLSYFSIKDSSCQCGCGETLAFVVTAKIKGEWFDQSVGVCKQCS